MSTEIGWNEPTEIEPEMFGANALVESTPFRIIWNQTTKGERPKKGGGTYTEYVITVNAKGYARLLRVKVLQGDYDKLRLLKMKGIEVYAAVGQIVDGSKYPTLIFAGGKWE